MKSFVLWLAQTCNWYGLEVPNITVWLVWFIIISTVLLMCLYGWSFVRLIFALRKALKRVAELKTPLVARDYQALDKFFRNETLLAGAWNEFAETLDLPDPQLEPDKRVKNSRQAEDFINHRTIYAHFINTSFCSAVPGMLTALGLLGTFISIFAALSVLRLENGEVSEIQPFINNLSGKFISSIAGIGASFIFLFFEKLFTGEINSKCHALQNALNLALTLANSDTTMLEMSNRLERIESFVATLPGRLNTLEGFVGTLPVHQKDLLNKVDDLLSTSNGIKASSDQIQIHTSDILTKREESVSNLVTSVVRAFREALVQQAKDDIDNMALGLQKAASTVEQMNNKLANSLEQYENAIKSQRQQIKDYLAEHQNASQSWAQDQQKYLVDFRNLYEVHIKELTQAQAEQLEKQMKEVQSSCDDILRTFERSATSFQQKVNAHIEALVIRLEASSESQQKELKALVTYILSGVESWTNSAQSGLSAVLSAAEQSSKKVEETTTGLQTALQTLNRTLSELKQMESSIAANGTTIGDVTRILKETEHTLADHSQTIAAVSTELNGLTASIAENNTVMKETSSDIREAGVSLSSSGSCLEEASKAINLAIACVDNTLAAMRESVGEFAKQAESQKTLFQSQENLWSKQISLYESRGKQLVESVEATINVDDCNNGHHDGEPEHVA